MNSIQNIQQGPQIRVEENKVGQSQERRRRRDQYKKVSKMSQGKYLCHDNFNNELCVIETINISRFPFDSENQPIQEKLKEFKKFDHENIIKCKDIWLSKDGERVSVLTSHASRGSLFEKIAKKQNSIRNRFWTSEQIIHIFKQLCLAVQYLHTKDFIHMCIEAQNVYFDEKGQLKLSITIENNINLDKRLERQDLSRLSYTPPEIVKGESFTKSSDIWQLGVILYNMCSLQMPFNGNHILAISRKICLGSSVINFDDFPPIYGNQIKNLIFDLLKPVAKERPTIDQILANLQFNDPVRIPQAPARIPLMPLLERNNNEIIRNQPLPNKQRKQSIIRPGA